MMPAKTNSLVAATRRYAVPVLLSASAAVGVVAFQNHVLSVHAAPGLGAGTAVAPLDPSSIAPLTALDTAMESLSARVQPSVVNIAVTSTPAAEAAEGNGEQGDSGAQEGGRQGGGQGALPPELQQFFGGNGGRMRPAQPEFEHGIGSGVIISPDGYILTNNHVIEGARDIKVTLHDRRVLNGHVVGTDKLTDLAVVKVNAADLPAIAWGDSNQLQQGQTVLAFGSPFGSLRFSVTRGIVSAVNRADPFRNDARKPGGYIQTDAAINPGNSGGPLVDVHGQLVGVNCSIITNSGQFAGAGFAIPSQLAHVISAQLIQHGAVEHGYLGIAMNDVSPDNAHFFSLKEASGAIVAQVTPNSPASRAGLQGGDVITALNGGSIVDSSALQVAVSEMRPDTAITLKVIRNGAPTTVHLTVGTYQADNQLTADAGAPREGKGQPGKLGLSVGDLTAEARQGINAPETLHGAVIQQVRPGSPAEDAGLQRGDVILQVNRKPTDSAQEFIREVHGAAGDGDLLLLVWSKGNASYLTLRPASDNEKS